MYLGSFFECEVYHVVFQLLVSCQETFLWRNGIVGRQTQWLVIAVMEGECLRITDTN